MAEQNEKKLGEKAAIATKWSLVTQLASKLISPITTLILAHLLVPEAFGIVALVTMVTSFADMFSDAGFQKYLIQHEYGEKEDYSLSCDVAFWTNLIVSLILWGLITLFNQQLAHILGNDGIGFALIVSSASLPLTSAVSVQTAVYQRSFDFKTLFYSRIGSATLILVVSVVLAFLGFDYWSMVIGTLASNVFLAFWLTAQSKWKPLLRYSFAELKLMFSFSAWTMVEAFSIWLTNWIGAFVLGALLTTYYLGLYNTAVSLCSAVIGIVTSAVNPILFASLSRVQKDRIRFDSAFYLMQKYLAFAVVPIAAGLAVFSEAVVGLYLGPNWLEATAFFGLYSLASAFVVVFCHTASDAYRALGKPKYSLLAQVLFLFIMIPSLVFGALQGWERFSIIVPIARLLGFVAIHFIICKFLMKLSPWKMITNLRWIYLATIIVSMASLVVVNLFNLGYVPQAFLMLFAGVLYLVLCTLVPDLRATLVDMLERFGLNRAAKKLRK